MLPLAPDATSAAFVASNGELAWDREDVEPALAAIRDSGQAILGGEVWLIVGPGSWNGLIPRLDGSPPTVWHWETEPRSTSESWQHYCERTAEESMNAVRDMPVEQATPPELIDRLRFNVTYVAETKT
jgi:hypothetical protein